MGNRVVSPVPFWRCEVNVLASFAFKSYKADEDLPKETARRNTENADNRAKRIAIQSAGNVAQQLDIMSRA